MWLLGLVLGAAFGSLLGIAGALLGGVLGVLIAREAAQRLARRQGNAPLPLSAQEQRLQTLEAQVDWLYRESQALRAELAVRRGAPATTPDGVPPAASWVATTTADAAPPLSEPATAGDSPAAAPAVAERESRLPALSAALDSAAATLDGSSAAPPTSWWSRLLAGNLLAKVGVVLLFFGVASGLRLAAELGLLPVPLRLLLAAVGGLAMLLFGWSQAQKSAPQPAPPTQQMFGLALQGGGLAIHYLLVYFMLGRYAMLGEASAFALFAALGVACVVLATRQQGELLAVFGIAGAFLAPLLAAANSADPRLLFAYFSLLNAFVLGIGWVHAWRRLNIAGFVLTLVVGMSWAIELYRPAHYLLIQGFLIAFCVMYSAASPLTALLRAPGWKGWGEGILLFGTPLAGSALQAALLGDDRYGLALSALLASVYYLGWWVVLYRRRDAQLRLLERCHLAIAIAFLTLAVPLAFGAQVTSALWAVEGVAVLWFGVRQQRRVAQAFGSAMQFLAGASFLAGLGELEHARPLFNDVCLGGVLIAAAGLAGARLLHASAKPLLPSSLLLAWALLWWFATAGREIDAFAPSALQIPLLLLFGALSLAALELYGGARRWPAARWAAALLLPLLWLLSAAAVLRDGHALAGAMLVVVPGALALHYWILARQEKAGRGAAGEAGAAMPQLVAARHVAAWWLLLLIAGNELAWLAQRLASGVSLWPLLGWGLLAAIGIRLPDAAHRQWPFAAQLAAYRGAATWPLALAAACWSVVANVSHAGGGSGLSYLPLFNAFDATQLLVLAALHGWLAGLRAAPLAGWPAGMRLRALPALLALLWISTLAARIAHHWGGVPFQAQALFHSGLLQGLLSVLWSALALAVMIRATRLRRRQGWYAGFALLAVVGLKLLALDLANAGTATWSASLIGVALLVLAASYLAPVPPREEQPLPEAPAEPLPPSQARAP
ncbi:DUF2339 domain-containing protein [Candidatus Accumulibacter sp. ACC003]|uniref:DUF2339 domain-containing protein n=1 Tax=Candidatus Accumulibacter sp. ACC003 TaxID=2823334 RepID=UPI0025C11F86|nr:DUF2339 domain-containing protein [Candidatus Accumulibacter sp. ACC003]